MAKLTRELILKETTRLYAAPGAGSFSVRQLAAQVGTVPSVIYYYFQNENDLLRQMFDYNSTQLGIKRASLPIPKSAKTMLKQRINFQLENAESIVAVLKYYITFRATFPKNKNGFVPDKSALHIEEVLQYGQKTGEFYSANITRDSKTIAHAINGFLLEYYPYKFAQNEKKQLINNIYALLIRALTNGGEKNGKRI